MSTARASWFRIAGSAALLALLVVFARHVDWRAVARGQPLLLKQFVGTGGQRVWLTWADVSGLPDVEAKLSQLCRWIVEAEREGFQYGLRLPGFEGSPSRGDRHRHHLLRALALFQSPSTPNFPPSTIDPRPSTLSRP